MAQAEVHRKVVRTAIESVRTRITEARQKKIAELVDADYGSFSTWRWLREVGHAENPGWKSVKFKTIEELEAFAKKQDSGFTLKYDIKNAKRLYEKQMSYVDNVDILMENTPDDFIVLSDVDIEWLGMR